jgi:hypothetical protein
MRRDRCVVLSCEVEPLTNGSLFENRSQLALQRDVVPGVVGIALAWPLLEEIHTTQTRQKFRQNSCSEAINRMYPSLAS